jgi:signal transduction histidine kinase/ActR/RegA family two-component response regulator
MWKPIRSRHIRYLLPFGAIVAAMLAQGAVSLVVAKGVDFPYAFFYLVAVFVVAWYGGYVPGAIACLLTTVGLPLAVTHSFRLAIDPTRVILFLGVSALISKVSIGQRRARGVLSDANEELDQRVRSRTQDLARAVEGLESEIVRRTKLEETLHKQLGRLSLLDQITRAIGERQDLRSIFQVVVRTLEDNLPIDFGCVCLYNPDTETLTVSCVGLNSEALAVELTMTEQARIVIDQNGLARCVSGHLVYEPDLSQLDFPFPRRLLKGGLGSVIAAPLRSESDIFGIIVVARRQINGFSSGDCEFLRQLSEHVAVAARQAQIYTALEQAYNDLRRTQQSVMEQERLRVLGQMASGIAHDINNALSPVALYTESLLEREANLSPRTRAYLETTQRAIGDVAHTVGRMREFCRPNAPQLMLMPVDLNALVGQVLDLTRARWSDMPQQRGIVIDMRTELDPDLPSVAGIESEIREALTNLIFNAVDSMTGGGTLTLRTRVTVDTDMLPSAGSRVQVQVQDTGVGMDEETRRRCLEPFFTTKGERGTGLGLAMVYGVAQRQNAKLEVESTPGVGTTMGLNFPAAPARTQLAQIARPAVPVSRLRILLVDDDPLIIRSLQTILEEDGHSVTTASGGQQGIDKLSAATGCDQQFAVVITDLGMPYVDGRKVASAVKTACSDTSVILLTGWGQRLKEDDDIPANVDRVLSKPPKLYQLRAALSELVPGCANPAPHYSLPDHVT